MPSLVHSACQDNFGEFSSLLFCHLFTPNCSRRYTNFKAIWGEELRRHSLEYFVWPHQCMSSRSLDLPRPFCQRFRVLREGKQRNNGLRDNTRRQHICMWGISSKCRVETVTLIEKAPARLSPVLRWRIWQPDKIWPEVDIQPLVSAKLSNARDNFNHQTLF